MKTLVKNFNEHINEHNSKNKSRMIGLLNQRLYSEMIRNYEEICKDLENEGFDIEDIEKFVFDKFKKDIKK